jgi:hypothetical protein
MGWRGFGFVHRSRTIFCRAVPNLSITIRNFFIAVCHGLGAHAFLPASPVGCALSLRPHGTRGGGGRLMPDASMLTKLRAGLRKTPPAATTTTTTPGKRGATPRKTPSKSQTPVQPAGSAKAKTPKKAAAADAVMEVEAAEEVAAAAKTPKPKTPKKTPAKATPAKATPAKAEVGGKTPNATTPHRRSERTPARAVTPAAAAAVSVVPMGELSVQDAADLDGLLADTATPEPLHADAMEASGGLEFGELPSPLPHHLPQWCCLLSHSLVLSSAGVTPLSHHVLSSLLSTRLLSPL